MNDYKAVRSSLDLSKSMVSLLEETGGYHAFGESRATAIRAINDILQGRAERSVDTMIREVEWQTDKPYSEAVAILREDIQNFLHQKALLPLKNERMPYRKTVNQRLYDQAVKCGFPKNFFADAYFDHVTIYCIPDTMELCQSVFQDCTFSVCRIHEASFAGASLYDCEFHSSLLDRASFFQASLSNTHFHDCEMSGVRFARARVKSCSMIDCTLKHMDFGQTVLDGCSFGRINASDIHYLETAHITQGGATEEECRRNRESIFQALGVGQEVSGCC